MTLLLVVMMHSAGLWFVVQLRQVLLGLLVAGFESSRLGCLLLLQMELLLLLVHMLLVLVMLLLIRTVMARCSRGRSLLRMVMRMMVRMMMRRMLMLGIVHGRCMQVIRCVVVGVRRVLAVVRGGR